MNENLPNQSWPNRIYLRYANRKFFWGDSVRSRLVMLVFPFCLLLAAACSADVYRNTIYGFSIDLPDGWRNKPGELDNTLVKSVRPDNSWRATTLTVAVHPLSDRNSKPDIWTITGDQLQKLINAQYPSLRPRLVDFGKTSLDGEPAIWYLHEMGSPGAPSVRSLTYQFIRDGRIFTLAGATDNDPVWFALNQPIFEASIQSFRFEKAGAGGAGRTINFLLAALDTYGTTLAIFVGFWVLIFVCRRLFRPKSKSPKEPGTGSEIGK